MDQQQEQQHRQPQRAPAAPGPRNPQVENTQDENDYNLDSIDVTTASLLLQCTTASTEIPITGTEGITNNNDDVGSDHHARFGRFPPPVLARIPKFTKLLPTTTILRQRPSRIRVRKKFPKSQLQLETDCCFYYRYEDDKNEELHPVSLFDIKWRRLFLALVVLVCASASAFRSTNIMHDFGGNQRLSSLEENNSLQQPKRQHPIRWKAFPSDFDSPYYHPTYERYNSSSPYLGGLSTLRGRIPPRTNSMDSRGYRTWNFSYLSSWITTSLSRIGFPFSVTAQYLSMPEKIEENLPSPNTFWRGRRLIGSRSGPSSPSSATTTSSSSTPTNDPQLVIAGKMSVDDALCNIAQYNLRTNEWSLSERIQLSLYNSYSGGEVYSLLANHTDRMIYTSSMNPTHNSNEYKNAFNSYNRNNNNRNNNKNSNSDNQEGSGELIVVGAFDTTYRNSQVTYCSVGKWDGFQLSKVGEGLCNSALSKGMKITTAAMAGPQDVYAAGSFQTQVWNGDRHEFVKIYNIAHYNAAGKEGPVWLPLNIGQITCSWCTVTVLALAWDSKRRQLHVAGKFNAIDGRNVPAGLAIYDLESGRLVAHPGGGLAMKNETQDGVGTALQLDEEKGVLYVMGSFERLTASSELCDGLAAYDINSNQWTCLANPAHTVQPTGGGNMILTPYGLMVAGKVSGKHTTWKDDSRPYTIALLHTTVKTNGDSETTLADTSSNDTTTAAADPSHTSSGSFSDTSSSKTSTKQPKKKGNSLPSPVSSLLPIRSSLSKSDSSNTTTINENNANQSQSNNVSSHEFEWSWLPGFDGNDEPLHALANGFGNHEGVVFIAGDNLVAKWSYQEHPMKSGSPTHNGDHSRDRHRYLMKSSPSSESTGEGTEWVAVTEELSTGHVRGAIMAISQMQLTPDPDPDDVLRPNPEPISNLNIRILITLAVGCLIGILGAVICNRPRIFPCFGFDFSRREEGIPLDTLQIGHTNITDAYQRAMKTRYVEQPHLLTIIDPQEIFLQRIIGEGTFGRVWSARWNSSSVAVKEFVFAQAAVIGRSSMQQEIVEEIIGEAGMMAILRHPNVLQLFGCSLTAQAIWIVSELCSLGSLRQVLDDRDRFLPDELKVNLALQVAEGMSYLHNQDPAIIHRDLKSHNIFVHETFIDTEQEGDTNIHGPSGDGQSNTLTRWIRPQKMKTHSTLVAKIGDWGSARATLSGSRTMTHGVGTACWLAPEVIKHARCSKYSDVYGYGIILWEMSTRDEVYQGLESTQIIAKVANEGLRPPVPENCPWRDVMVKCWAETPKDRLGFNEVVAELNRISKEFDEAHSHKENNKVNLHQPETIEEKCDEDNAEETPLLTNDDPISKGRVDDQKNGKANNIFSTILRQRRGV